MAERLKLSRPKMVHLSHVVVEGLEKHPDVLLIHDRNDVRLRIFDLILEEAKADAEMDATARKKISSMSRPIPEGSEEWEVLYRQYYREEIEKRGKVR